MIEDTVLQNILETCSDYSLVVEIYQATATPASDGFNPNNALGCFAAVADLTFMNVAYTRLIKRIGSIKKTITQESNTASVTFSNISRAITAFEFDYGFEGLIMVVRGLSRGQSNTLAKSKIEFVGRCDKPRSGDKDQLTVTAKFILGALDVYLPRRAFGPEDHQGRATTHPESEAFIYTPFYGSVSFPRVIKRGGFLGWWNKKTIIVTQPYSNYDAQLDGSRPVPEVFGRTQVLGVTIAASDVGLDILMRVAFCEGPISDIYDAYSIDPALPINGVSNHRGLVGIANGDDAGWPGPGYYSKTAYINTKVSNSLLEVSDPPPDIAAIIWGKLVTTPNAAGVWNTEAWTNNPAAVCRHLITSTDYCKLDAAWVDDTKATECFNFNAEPIFNTAVTDFVFVDA